MLALILALALTVQDGKPEGSTEVVRPAAAAADAQADRFVVTLGQSAVVRFASSDRGGARPTVVGLEPAANRMQDALMAYMAEHAAVRQRQTGDRETIGGIPSHGEPVAPPTAGEVRFTFGPGPDGASVLLIVENGDARVLDYRAVMRLADGRTTPTTICRVPQGMRVVESWSDPIVALELGAFELLDPAPDWRSHATVCD